MIEERPEKKVRIVPDSIGYLINGANVGEVHAGLEDKDAEAIRDGKAKLRCVKHLCFTRLLNLIYGEIHMQMLILCLTCREKIMTPITQVTDKKLFWWTLWKKWTTKELVTKLLITLYYMEN